MSNAPFAAEWREKLASATPQEAPMQPTFVEPRSRSASSLQRGAWRADAASTAAGTRQSSATERSRLLGGNVQANEPQVELTDNVRPVGLGGGAAMGFVAGVPAGLVVGAATGLTAVNLRLGPHAFGPSGAWTAEGMELFAQTTRQTVRTYIGGCVLVGAILGAGVAADHGELAKRAAQVGLAAPLAGLAALNLGALAAEALVHAYGVPSGSGAQARAFGAGALLAGVLATGAAITMAHRAASSAARAPSSPVAEAASTGDAEAPSSAGAAGRQTDDVEVGATQVALTRATDRRWPPSARIVASAGGLPVGLAAGTGAGALVGVAAALVMGLAWTGGGPDGPEGVALGAKVLWRTVAAMAPLGAACGMAWPWRTRPSPARTLEGVLGAASGTAMGALGGGLIGLGMASLAIWLAQAEDAHWARPVRLVATGLGCTGGLPVLVAGAVYLGISRE